MENSIKSIFNLIKKPQYLFALVSFYVVTFLTTFFLINETTNRQQREENLVQIEMLSVRLQKLQIEVNFNKHSLEKLSYELKEKEIEIESLQLFIKKVGEIKSSNDGGN